MPIKLPKVLARRRSSGNLLDVVEDSPAQPSFRVLNRQEVESHHAQDRGFEVTRKSGRWTTGPPVTGSSEEPKASNDRGSNRTNDSISTLASSTRFSNGSTLPSSIDSTSQDDLFLPDRPASVPPPRANAPKLKHRSTFGFSSSTGGGFTLFNKTPLSNDSPAKTGDGGEIKVYRTPDIQKEPPSNDAAIEASKPRSRADLEPDDHEEEHGLESMFELLANERRTHTPRMPLAPPPVARSDSEIMLQSRNHRRCFGGKAPAPIEQDLHRPPAPEIYRTHSWESNESAKAFLTSSSTTPIDEDAHVQADGSTQLVMDALYASQMLDQQHGQMPLQATHVVTSSISPATPSQAVRNSMTLHNDIDSGTTTDVTIRNTTVRQESNPYFGTIPAEHSREGNRFFTMPRMGNKVMTTSEFEHYKRQQALSKPDDSRSEVSEDSTTYEDEDETERTQEIANQRRKQEAKLAVYRQSMMKMTGVSPAIDRPGLERATQSTPNLLEGFLSRNTFSSSNEQGQMSNDDEDDDTPLDVLQAHGFPNKTRPPNRMFTRSAVDLTSRTSTYPAPPGSTRNDAAAGGGGSLPPFAKKLPLDPYIGANLVKPTNRESLSARGPLNRHSTTLSSLEYNTGLPPSHLRPAVSHAHSMVPPGGLIGVIAEEERARALRRASSNLVGPLLQQALMTPQQTSAPGTPYSQISPWGQPPMTATEQSQLQVNTSMHQMMQLQMQWMAQMMQTQGLPPQPYQTTLHPQLPQVSRSAGPSSRSGSMAFPTPSPSIHHLRSKSTLSIPLITNDYFGGAYGGAPSHSPHTSQTPYGSQAPRQSPQPDVAMYAPSIAPSERSNVGQPARYRPVSTIGIPAGKSVPLPAVVPRASTLSVPVMFRRTTNEVKKADKGQATGLLKPVAGNVGISPELRRRQVLALDDDEEENDAEYLMQVKRDREQSAERWRRSRKVMASRGPEVPQGEALDELC